MTHDLPYEFEAKVTPANTSTDGVRSFTLGVIREIAGWSVTRYLVRVHKWSGRTKYDDINGPTRTIYVIISGPPKA